MIALTVLLAAGNLEAPASVELADVPVHTPQEAALALTNAGDRTLKVRNIALDGDPALTLEAPRTVKIRPGETRTLTVRATPEEPARMTGTVRMDVGEEEVLVDVRAWTPGLSPHQRWSDQPNAGVLGALHDDVAPGDLFGDMGVEPIGGLIGAGGPGGSSGGSGKGTTSEYGALELDGVRVSFGDPIILGALDKAVIDAVLLRQRSAFADCFRNVPAAGSGKVTVKFTIATTGEVSQSVLKSTTVNNAEVEACVVQVIGAQRFPSPEGGGIVIASYPVRLARL